MSSVNQRNYVMETQVLLKEWAKQKKRVGEKTDEEG